MRAWLQAPPFICQPELPLGWKDGGTRGSWLGEEWGRYGGHSASPHPPMALPAPALQTPHVCLYNHGSRFVPARYTFTTYQGVFMLCAPRRQCRCQDLLLQSPVQNERARSLAHLERHGGDCTDSSTCAVFLISRCALLVPCVTPIDGLFSLRMD